MLPSTTSDEPPGSMSATGGHRRPVGMASGGHGYAFPMSAENKAANKVDEMAGKAKEVLGRATDNRDLEAEGKGEQAKSNLKQAGEKVKDAFK